MHARISSFAAVLAGGLLVALATSAGAAGPADPDAAKQAIREAAKGYIQSLQNGHVDEVLEFWTDDGDIVDEFGQAVPAKDTLRKDAAARVAAAANQNGARPQIKVTKNAIRFVTPDVAIEDGQVEVNGPAGVPRPGRFTAVWVKEGDAWKLASLREVRLNASAASQLEALDWMVGDWSGESSGAKFEVSTHWNEPHTYLIRDLVVSLGDKTIVNGQQRIGIDPLDGQIKSWMHDTGGGHGEGVWTHHGNAWVVQATGVTAAGHRTTGTNVYRKGEDGTLIWKSIGSTVAGKPMPDFEIQLKRSGAPAETAAAGDNS